MRGYKAKFREIWWDDFEWIHLAKDRHQWRAIVNTVMKLWDTYIYGGAGLAQ
jgi:hypothetical protein